MTTATNQTPANTIAGVQQEYDQGQANAKTRLTKARRAMMSRYPALCIVDGQTRYSSALLDRGALMHTRINLQSQTASVVFDQDFISHPGTRSIHVIALQMMSLLNIMWLLPASSHAGSPYWAWASDAFLTEKLARLGLDVINLKRMNVTMPNEKGEMVNPPLFLDYIKMTNMVRSLAQIRTQQLTTLKQGIDEAAALDVEDAKFKLIDILGVSVDPVIQKQAVGKADQAWVDYVAAFQAPELQTIEAPAATASALVLFHWIRDTLKSVDDAVAYLVDGMKEVGLVFSPENTSYEEKMSHILMMRSPTYIAGMPSLSISGSTPINLNVLSAMAANRAAILKVNADRYSGNNRGANAGHEDAVVPNDYNDRTDLRNFMQLQATMGQGDSLRLSFSRPNRFGKVPRQKLTSNGKVLHARDVSGSMGTLLLQVSMALTKNMHRQGIIIDDMQVDAGVQVIDKEAGRSLTKSTFAVRGRGGTDMCEVYRYLNSKPELQYDTVMVSTDGYTPYPTREMIAGRRALWIIFYYLGEKVDLHRDARSPYVKWANPEELTVSYKTMSIDGPLGQVVFFPYEALLGERSA